MNAKKSKHVNPAFEAPHSIKPYEVAFLVREYLKENGCQETLKTFLKEHPLASKGRVPTNRQGLSLKQILNNYLELRQRDLVNQQVLKELQEINTTLRQVISVLKPQDQDLPTHREISTQFHDNLGAHNSHMNGNPGSRDAEDVSYSDHQNDSFQIDESLYEDENGNIYTSEQLYGQRHGHGSGGALPKELFERLLNDPTWQSKLANYINKARDYSSRQSSSDSSNNINNNQISNQSEHQNLESSHQTTINHGNNGHPQELINGNFHSKDHEEMPNIDERFMQTFFESMDVDCLLNEVFADGAQLEHPHSDIPPIQTSPTSSSGNLIAIPELPSFGDGDSQTTGYFETTPPAKTSPTKRRREPSPTRKASFSGNLIPSIPEKSKKSFSITKNMGPGPIGAPNVDKHQRPEETLGPPTKKRKIV